MYLQHVAHSPEGEITVILSGRIETWPEEFNEHQGDRPNDAKRLLDLYSDVMSHEPVFDDSKLLNPLKSLEGSFAFVLFDKRGCGHVLASKDGRDSQPLFWGCTPEGGLLFGTERSLLDRCDPTATSFPNGVLFSSQGSLLASCPGSKGWSMLAPNRIGHLLSFEHPECHVKTIPRVNSKGVLCGAVYRVASLKSMDQSIST